jgi:exosortase
MEVAEACSGIQSLFSLLTLAIVYGYMGETNISLRILLALAAVPISILANAFRIFATSFVCSTGHRKSSGELSHTFRMADFHEFPGHFLVHRGLRILDPAMPESANQGEGA